MYFLIGIVLAIAFFYRKRIFGTEIKEETEQPLETSLGTLGAISDEKKMMIEEAIEVVNSHMKSFHVDAGLIASTEKAVREDLEALARKEESRPVQKYTISLPELKPFTDSYCQENERNFKDEIKKIMERGKLIRVSVGKKIGHDFLRPDLCVVPAKSGWFSVNPDIYAQTDEEKPNFDESNNPWFKDQGITYGDDDGLEDDWNPRRDPNDNIKTEMVSICYPPVPPVTLKSRTDVLKEYLKKNNPERYRLLYDEPVLDEPTFEHESTIEGKTNRTLELPNNVTLELPNRVLKELPNRVNGDLTIAEKIEKMKIEQLRACYESPQDETCIIRRRR